MSHIFRMSRYLLIAYGELTILLVRGPRSN